MVCLPLEEAGFANAFSTRVGGVSAMPDKSLHLSFKNGVVEEVRENRRRFLSAAGLSGKPIVTLDQTHSSNIAIVDDLVIQTVKRNDQQEFPGDAIISEESHFLAGVKTADCLPILIGDPMTGAFAAIHAGWKGTLDRITEKAVAMLKENFGTKPENCLAAMGPSACGGCYEVGPDVANPFRKNFSFGDDLVSPTSNTGKFFLDVKLANAMQLLAAGLSPMNIFGADECTMHENELFFSHRLEGKSPENRVGRMLSVIGRKSD